MNKIKIIIFQLLKFEINYLELKIRYYNTHNKLFIKEFI